MLRLFLQDCRLRNLSPATLKCYNDRVGYLRSFADERETTLDKLRRSDIKDYLFDVTGTVSPETVNGRIRAFRRFYNFLVEESVLTESPMDRIRLQRCPRKLKPVLARDKVQQLLNHYGRDFHGLRNKVMILCMYDGMMRLSELLGVKLSDLDEAGKFIKVTGKGAKERLVPLTEESWLVAEKYLKIRRRLPGDYLICDEAGERTTKTAFYSWMNRLKRATGIHVYAHLLRHSGATEYIRQGGSEFVLQTVMGHSSLLTTRLYCQVKSEDAIRLHGKFGPGCGLKMQA